MELIYNKIKLLNLKLLDLHRKLMMEVNQQSKELSKFNKFNMIHYFHQLISIEKFQEDKDPLLLKFFVLLQEKLQLKISKTGKFLLVFQIGKIFEVIQSLFIWGLGQMAVIFSKIQLIKVSQIVLIRFILLKDKLKANCKKELVFKKV